MRERGDARTSAAIRTAICDGSGDTMSTGKIEYSPDYRSEKKIRQGLADMRAGRIRPVSEVRKELGTSGRDHSAPPEEMDDDYLVELAFQLYARACALDCTEELHNRAMELKREVLRRVKGEKHDER
jgi:hypothetical protein